MLVSCSLSWMRALCVLTRLDRQVQCLGDVGHALAGDDAPEHVEFAIRQLRVPRSPCHAGELLDHVLGQAGRDVGAAGGDLAHRRDQLGGGAVLGEVAAGTGLEGAHRVLLLGMHAQHHHLDLGVFGLDAAYEIQTGHARHRQVDDREREGLAPQAFERLKARGRFGDGPLGGDRLQDALDAFTHDGVVVDQQQPTPGRRRRCTQHDPPREARVATG